MHDGSTPTEFHSGLTKSSHEAVRQGRRHFKARARPRAHSTNGRGGRRARDPPNLQRHTIHLRESSGRESQQMADAPGHL